MSTDSIPLGDLVEIVGGGTPSRSVPEFWNGGIPWATVKDMTSVELSETQEFISDKGVSTSATRIVPAGSVIMATRMGLGKVAINKIDLAINQDLKALKCNGNLDPKFLLYFLQSKAEYLESQGKGATVKGIKLDLVKRLPVPRLTLPEQRRVATILDKADAIRRKRRQGIDLMNDFLRSVFLEMFGDPDSNPKKWKVSRIADVIEHFEGGKSFKSPEDDNVNGKTRILKISAVSWGEFNPSESKPVPDTYVPPKNHFVRQGDLLISRANTSELVGAVSYVFDPPPPVILPDKLWRFVFRKDTQVRPIYLLVLFQQQAIRNELSRLGTGTSGSMKNISMGKLMGMKIPVPGLKLQSAFEELFLKYRQAVTAMNRELGLANELSLSLQNDLFGE